jgi:predicted enzyme related to lactoylglutathione lyase
VPCGSGTIVFFTVPEIDETIPKVNRSGGQTLMPRTSGGEHGSIAHFEDGEGNVVGLYSDREGRPVSEARA